ncbi:DUF1016 domain-containing protein (plasmid) [Phyllobacterium sp. A18/5-2]|uniref:DUF1016 domain-containing protein n=1 Tax=Phyllobacterium sp. A18/5-2 TaxID=2978392 RepID=UPI0021C6A3FF|nr:DUF1016 domain-containing protein [Phyllobacterium sp. A18/5-2]UXN67264.1 DUF1016 domain-containing protein [Phyllobacterium sp. A18/5-2]
MSEREVEKAYLSIFALLILEVCKGFAFVGSQHHIEVGGQDLFSGSSDDFR